MKESNNSVIITLTGSSLSGKSYVMDKIIEAKEVLKERRIGFEPTLFPKYTTRTYRENEIKKKRDGEFVDVIPVDEIPEECDLVYRTYGKDYGLQIKDLQYELDNQRTPVVVINDVRAVEELKTFFPGRVLSLYLFRRIPNTRDYEEATGTRGNVEMQEYIDRYNKAVSMYRVYIENINIFDRVILNVKNYTGNEHEIDYTKTQIINLLHGVFEGKIKLAVNIYKSPRLFIISGGAASGKDDVIQAVTRMGKLQASILPKYTSRRQADDDGDEMICQFVPKKDIINEYQVAYDNRYNETLKKYEQSYDKSFLAEYEKSYLDTKSKEPFQDYCAVQWEIKRLNELRAIDKPLVRFWNKVSETLKIESEERVLSDFFQINSKYFIELEKLEKPSSNSKVWEVFHSNENYIVYENNKNSIRYGFSIFGLKENMKDDRKHRVLVASLPEIFGICIKQLKKENVITIYAYSQIDKDDFLETADPTMAEMKLENLDDLIRYSEHIVEFDHVLIYATTSMKDGASGVKEELIDQMFRLFRTY